VIDGRYPTPDDPGALCWLGWGVEAAMRGLWFGTLFIVVGCEHRVDANLPIDAELVVEPAAPCAGDVVVASVSTDVPAFFQWSLDGDGWSVEGATLDPRVTRRFDRWNVRVTFEGSTTVLEETIEIDNCAPNMQSVQIGPDGATALDVLWVEATAADPDDDDVVYTYRWTVNGVLVSEGTSPWLAPGAFVRGDEVEVEVTADDGDKVAVGTDSMVIANSTPLPPTDVRIVETRPFVGHPITCAWRDSVDPDGDELSYEVVWTRDGAGVSISTTDIGETVAVLAADVAGPEERWGCSVQAIDPDGAVSTNVHSADREVSGWTMVDGAWSHTCGIATDGSLYCWGFNNYGQLGIGGLRPAYVPTVIAHDEPWVSVAAGDGHTCAIDGRGRLYCWGANWSGQLGIGAPPPSDSSSTGVPPTRVGSAADWTSVSALGSHTCGIRSPGRIFCWGDNWAGQSGHSSESYYVWTPGQVTSLQNWVEISAGGGHTCGRQTSRDIYCWGAGWNGQFGASFSGSTAVPQLVPGGSDWARVDTGYDHVCALRTTGRLWCWGYNWDGQVGTGSTGDSTLMTSIGSVNWADLALGGQHSCVLNSAGQPSCTGSNYDSQLGLGPAADYNRTTLTSIPASPSFERLFAGANTTFGITPDGRLFGWGRNYLGQTGVDTLDPVVFSPSLVGLPAQ
jgi:hypothetical protein